jgi:hypothetical protein
MSENKLDLHEDVSKQVVEMLMQCNDLLDGTVAIVKDNSETIVFENYRDQIANIIADIGLDILEVIFQKYPHLRPY